MNTDKNPKGRGRRAIVQTASGRIYLQVQHGPAVEFFPHIGQPHRSLLLHRLTHILRPELAR